MDYISGIIVASVLIPVIAIVRIELKILKSRQALYDLRIQQLEDTVYDLSIAKCEHTIKLATHNKILNKELLKKAEDSSQIAPKSEKNDVSIMKNI